MPLERSRAQQNQRTDVVDFLRTNDSAFANLYLAIRNFVAPSDAVLRGGELEPTSPPSMAVTLKTLAASTSSGLVIVESDQVLAIAPADATNPRIDLVSVGYAEAEADAEERVFINQADQLPFNQTVNTRVRATPDVVVTTGTPGTNPSAPSPPAGHIPLWEVNVPAGATSVDTPDFTRVETGLATRIRGIGWSFSATVLSPFVSNPLVVTVPQGGAAVLLAGTTVDVTGSSFSYACQILRDGSGLDIGGFAEIPKYNAVGGSTSDRASILVAGIATQAGSGSYTLRVDQSPAGYIPFLIGNNNAHFLGALVF